MQPLRDTPRWLVVRSALVTVGVFLAWLLLSRDLREAATYALVLGAVDAAVGFTLHAWRRGKPTSGGDFLDPIPDE